MSSPGYISISAITMLTSPRPIDPQKGNRNVVFDTTLYIGECSQTSTLALFRYFIPDHLINILQDFSPERPFKIAFIVANVCSFSITLNHPNFVLTEIMQISSITKDTIPNNLVPENVEITDYAFVGDILQVSTFKLLKSNNNKWRISAAAHNY